MLEDVANRCNAIEECYEFMLAYAAQGLPADQGSEAGGQLRHLLGKAVSALSGMSDAYAKTVKQAGLEAPERYRAFLGVLDRDANDSLAILQLVLAQPCISSQLIDNVNASIHLRALLTDLFVIDELINLHKASKNVTAG